MDSSRTEERQRFSEGTQRFVAQCEEYMILVQETMRGEASRLGELEACLLEQIREAKSHARFLQCVLSVSPVEPPK